MDGAGGKTFQGIARDKAPEPKLGSRPITGDRYTSPEFMRLEWEKMWTKVWMIGAMSDQLKAPGDFVTCAIGRESILLARGKDGKARAFYNVCRHRGNQLVHSEEGRVESHFTCAYHGWKWALDGALDWVYCPEDFPQGNPCGKLRLGEIPCEEWAGFVWYNMDEQAAPLRQWLAPVAEHLDGYRMERMKRTHWVTLEGEFNWKCVQDNFNESYHLPFVHPQVLAFMDERHENCQFDLYPTGHCRMLMPGGGPNPNWKGDSAVTLAGLGEELEFWEIDVGAFEGRVQDLRLALQQQKRKLGASKGYDFSLYSDEQLTDHYHYTIFPNLSFSMKPDGCIWLRANPHPSDPNKCSFDMWYLTLFPEGAKEYYSASMAEWVSVDASAPHQTGKVGEVSCGPGIDQDVAIWATQQKGFHSRGYQRETLAWQERRVRYFHDMIDRYVYGA